MANARRGVRRAAGVVCVLALTGCIDLAGLASGGPQGERPSEPLRQLSLYDGEVIVAGPRGYCIDADHMKRGVFGAFIPLASCESLRQQAGVGVEPGLLTVAVLPRQTADAMPDAAELAASMEGDEALQTIDGDGLSIVQFATGGARALPGGDPRYWRAGMVINGHLVGLAVYAREGSPLAGRRGLRLIMALAEELRGRSPQMAEVTRAAPRPGDP